METDPESKLITCILPKGAGTELVERLSKEKQMISANVSSCRGRGAGSVGSIGAWDEVDMLTVTVPVDRADEIFDFIYHVGGIDRPRGGIMYQQAVHLVTTFTLPDI